MAGLAASIFFHRGPLPGEPEGRYLELDGVRLRYRDVGEGPPVVLLHGFGSALDVWDVVSPALARRHRVLALDLKGFGFSDRPPGDYSPSAQASLVLRFLEARGVAQAAVVGHSWGASVALAAALAAPERISRLALVGGWIYEAQLPPSFLLARVPGLGEWLFGVGYGLDLEAQLRRAFFDPRHVTPALLARVREAIDRPGGRAAALACVRGQRLLSLERRYREVRPPVLLAWGEDDAISPLPFATRLLGDLPSARLKVYRRCGHFPMLEAPRALAADLRRFLRPGRAEPARAGREGDARPVQEGL